MTDRFTECLVKKVPDSNDNLKRVLIIIAVIAVTAITAFLAFATGFYLFLIVTMAVIYGAYYLFKCICVEYEYTFTNGELDIDKIIGQRKRQHLVTFNSKKIEDFGEVNADTPERPNITLFLCSDNTGIGEYYADFTTEEYGEARIIFTPSDKMLSYIEESLPLVLKYRKRNI